MNTREATNQVRLSQWAQIVQNRCDSGLSIEEYCAQSGITRHQYYYWLRKLRAAAISVSTEQNKLIEIEQPLALPVANDTALHDRGNLPFIPEMTISFNGISLNINSSTPVQLIQKVLEVLPHA